MLSLTQIFLIALVVVSFLFFNTKIGNKVLEKNILLKSLLFAVSLFIKTENDQKGNNFKSKMSMGFAKFILNLDMWFLNSRSNERKKQKIVVKEKKERE